MRSPEQGAATAVFAALGKDIKGGRYCTYMLLIFLSFHSKIVAKLQDADYTSCL